MDGLIVTPTNNNGPTAKRAFEDEILLAEILHAPEFVTVRTKILFEALKSGFFLLIPELTRFCEEFREEFFRSDYKWHQFSPTVHMLWIHCPVIVAFIQSFGVTVADCNEEGGEAKNKTFRHDRAHHSRQTGYEDQLTDIITRSHNIASPQIQRLLPPSPKVAKTFRPEVEALLDRSRPVLQPPPPPQEPSESGEPMEVDAPLDGQLDKA